MADGCERHADGRLWRNRRVVVTVPKEQLLDGLATRVEDQSVHVGVVQKTQLWPRHCKNSYTDDATLNPTTASDDQNPYGP